MSSQQDQGQVPADYRAPVPVQQQSVYPSFTDIDGAEVALLLGVNPTQGHPVVGARIKQAALRGCKLITIDPRRIELADYGAIHLAPRPGTNAAVVLGLCHVIHREGLVDEAFIAERTEGWEAVEELLAGYDPASVEEITGIPAADLEAAAILYGTIPFDAGVTVTPGRLAGVPTLVAQGDQDDVIPRELLDRT